MVDGGGNYQGFSELDQQFTEQGYSNPQQQEQQQPAPDIVIVPQQQQQPPQQQSPVAVNPVADGPNDINKSLMDSVGQHDVFSPGQ